MDDGIIIPRAILKLLPTAILKGVFLCLLERADEQGTLDISVRGLADEMGVSYQTIRTALSKLEDSAVINAASTQLPTRRLTHINICNYEYYLAPTRKGQRGRQRKTNAVANADPTLRTQPRFSPPTDEEVRTYVFEMGYHFNPEKFVSYYQSKGWRVGNTPMKDWKAACRTWEAKSKEDYSMAGLFHDLKPKEHEAGQQDKFSRRRGVDTSTLSAKDYTGSL